MVKMWILASITCIIKLIYFLYYFGREREFSHKPWSLGRLYSVRQVWGAGGIALLLFRGSIFIDILLHIESREQSLLIILVDITQFLFWTSISFPFPVTIGFCFIEGSIQLIRLWGSSIELNSKLSILCTIIIFIYCLTAIIVARSMLITIEKSCNILQGIQSISQTKHRMVHLLCTVILTPIHTIVESIRNIDNNFMIFKHWNNRIVCATNQVVLYSNNFLMLVRIEEGRFQFECVNMMHIPTIVESVINRLPILGDSINSNINVTNLPSIIYSSSSDGTVVLSDSKALSFILENTLTYCLNVTRRKAVELKGRLRRQVYFHEFQPIDISMKVINRHEAKKNEPNHFMQFIITFGILSSSLPQTGFQSSSLSSSSSTSAANNNFTPASAAPTSSSMTAASIHPLNITTREMIFTAIHSITSEYDVCIQSALDEIKQPRYLQEMLHNIIDSNEVPLTLGQTSTSSTDQKQTRQSTILMTAKQMLDSCGGSLRLLEIKSSSSNSLDIKSSGDINIIVLNVPCHLRDDLAPMKDINSGMIRFEQVRGNFDFGILVTDNELSEYAQRMFLQCNVKCCRITNNSHIPLNNYSAIITDSLATYANLRVRGFRGKVVVMSAAAVYIDGNSTHRSCDYVLPVPCELSDVQGLVQSIYNENFLPNVSLPSSYVFVKIEEKLRSYSSIPFIYFICELITSIKGFFASLTETFQEALQWLKLRAQSRLDKERERNEIFQLGRQYDLIVNFFQTSFRNDIENDYLKWKIFHTPPFWNNKPNDENQRDYTPSSIKSTEGQYITPSSSIFLLIHFVLVLFMLIFCIHNIYHILPLITIIPLVGTIHFFNFKGFRKLKISNNYWNIIQYLVICIYIVTMLLLLLGPNPIVSQSERQHFHEIVRLQVGKFKFGQVLCFAIFSPLVSKTVSLVSFSHHHFVKNCIAIATIISIGLCIPKLFREEEATLAYIILLPAFPFLHQKTISQYWMRKWYQNTQKYHFSQEFVTKCTEIVWKELRYPLKTLIDYHEEYLQFTLQNVNRAQGLTPTLMQHLTTYRLGNLLLMEIQTVLKLKEILDSGRTYVTENKSKVSMNLQNELINIGRVFESITPVTIKVYFRMEQNIPCHVIIDKDLVIAVLVNTFSQSVACIKSKVNIESRAISLVHEIVVTLSTYMIDNKLFLKFQAMDSGNALSLSENENTIFQEDLCRQCILALNGTFERDICSHSTYRNIVSFSFPIQLINSQSLLWKGDYYESGYKHNLKLEKYLARNINSSGNNSRYHSRLGKHILIIAQKENLDMISRIFRMQKWECMEVESLSHLNYYLLNHSDIDVDAILVDRKCNQFGAFGDEDIISIAIKLRNVFDGACLAGLVNHKSDMTLSDGYDVIITRPIMDSELKNIMNVCDTITLKDLLWIN